MENSKKESKYQDSIMRFDSLFVSKDGRFLIIKIGSNTVLIKTDTILKKIEEKEQEKKGA
jgi:hypothetical protein